MAPMTFNQMLGESDLQAMQGGLSNPVIQSQEIFRAVMDAMSMPGKIISISTDACPPAPMSALCAAILFTLADTDTPVWLDEAWESNQALNDWLTFHITAPFAKEPAEANFAVLQGGLGMLPLEVFSKGQQDYPDRSATLIIQVETLGNGPHWQLSGPGIKTSTNFTVGPLTPLFLAQWHDNNGLFPRGLDVIFVSPDSLACLPRTTSITQLEPTRVGQDKEQ